MRTLVNVFNFTKPLFESIAKEFPDITGKSVTNNMPLLFFSDMCLPYAFDLYLQAVNLCLWRRVRFAHPRLQHGLKACQGLRPWTPGCIPTFMLAVLYPNMNVGCPLSQHQCWLHFI
jgi:hypothetical protein